MKRIVAVNSNCYHGFSIEEATTGIQRAGFSHIELTATKGWTEHVFPTMPLRRLWEVKDALREAGLSPFALSGHTNLMDPGRIDDFIANMRLAAFFGSRYIVSSVGEAHLEDKAVATNSQVAAQLRALVPHLEEYGLSLALEVHGDHGTGHILKEIVDLVASPLVGINYDTANAIFYGGVDIADDLKACVRQVNYVHLKDKAGARTEWNFPALGKGTIDFPAVLGILDEADNSSPLSIEIEFTQAGPKDLAEVDAAVADSAAYLRSIGVEF